MCDTICNDVKVLYSLIQKLMEDNEKLNKKIKELETLARI